MQAANHIPAADIILQPNQSSRRDLVLGFSLDEVFFCSWKRCTAAAIVFLGEPIALLLHRLISPPYLLPSLLLVSLVGAGPSALLSEGVPETFHIMTVGLYA